jgi:hypothetical protein
LLLELPAKVNDPLTELPFRLSARAADPSNNITPASDSQIVRLIDPPC